LIKGENDFKVKSEGNFMQDAYTKQFMDALKDQDIEALKQIPKADLHNHFVLGGNREYIKKMT